MNSVAIIPARGGSSGIFKKNLQKIGNFSLVQRSLQHALESELFSKIIISTDSYEIAREIKPNLKVKFFEKSENDCFIEVSDFIVVHKRRKELSTSESLISELLFQLSKILYFDYLWLLQPTTPFREKREFSAIYDLIADLNLQKFSWSSLVSVANVDGFHPDRMYKLKGKILESLLPRGNVDNVPRQSLEPIYIKDGGFYILKYENLSNSIMLGSEIVPFKRENFLTINIDELSDLILAQAVYERNLCR